ncbi:MAG: 30S ribosomal protein S18 [Candidatus Levyibacteriota bacterium]|jgi:small subunit ribosomal protein S18
MAKKKKIIRKRIAKNTPKECYFCVEKKEPEFQETAVLNKFITDRAKIISGVRSGLCSKHQKRVTRAIKRARHLALLPFVVKV